MRPALLLCVLGGAAGFLAPSPHRIARGGARWATFPALSDDEISRALEKVPVFAISDAEGNAAVMAMDGSDASALNFFMDVKHALSAKQYLAGQTEGAAEGAAEGARPELRVAAQSLGKMWSTYKNAAAPSGAAERANVGAVRFISSPTELDAARAVIASGTISAAEVTRDELRAAYLAAEAAATAEAGDDAPSRPRFGAVTDVPVFSISQMRMSAGGENAGSQRVLFFSMSDLTKAWRGVCDNSGMGEGAFEDGELQIVSLDELIDQMRAPSEVDHRGTILVPAASSLAAIGADSGSKD